MKTSTDLLDTGTPPAAPVPLVALWHAHRGDWNRAHALVQDEAGAEAAWVHAHLHRVEGDAGNAGYWYRRAGRPAASGDLVAERAAIAAALAASGPGERKGGFL